MASSSGSASSSSASATTLNARRLALAAALGKPGRFLIGLGGTEQVDVQNQKLSIDLFERYLNQIGPGSWRTWNSPDGTYVQVVAAQADAVKAVPMYTLYQMATRGDGNLTGLTDTAFMTEYWASVRMLFTQLRTYGKPALVNFEPDFWGYAQRVNANPAAQFVYVGAVNADCAGLSNDIVGLAGCLVQMARQYAPKAYVGFPPSRFEDLANTELAYMQAIGAHKADFVVMQTSDRDIGCIEAQVAAAGCNRPLGLFRNHIWDMSNLTTPNFAQHLASAKVFADAYQIPLVWWQTPLGALSSTPGGTTNAYRDNRAMYFLSHADELVAAGGLAAVFSAGASSQTTVRTDGGQFKALSTTYQSKTAPLPP